MREDPLGHGGWSRGKELLKRHVFDAYREESAFAGRWPVAEAATVPVAMPKARFRRERFGGFGYQSLNDQRTRLWPFDFRVLVLIDGRRDRAEILGALQHQDLGLDDLEAHLDETLARLIQGNLLRWSDIRKDGRTITVENYEEVCTDPDRLSTPLVVLWEPSLECNMRCRFCYSESGPGCGGGGHEDARVREFVDSGVFQVTLLGGEPLVHPRFAELVHGLEDGGIGVEFVTNGWLLTEKNLNLIADETNICQLMVSIDATAEVHDDIRGTPGAFARAIKGVHRFSEAGFEVTVTSTLTRKTAHTLPDLIDAVADSGARRMKIRPLALLGRGSGQCADEGMTLADIERYHVDLRRKAEEVSDRLAIVHSMPATEPGLCACDYNPTKPGAITGSGGTCGIGRMMAYVRHDGGVAPTSTMRDEVVGFLGPRSFLDIWCDETWKRIRPVNRAGYGILNV